MNDLNVILEDLQGRYDAKAICARLDFVSMAYNIPEEPEHRRCRLGFFLSEVGDWQEYDETLPIADGLFEDHCAECEQCNAWYNSPDPLKGMNKPIREMDRKFGWYRAISASARRLARFIDLHIPDGWIDTFGKFEIKSFNDDLPEEDKIHDGIYLFGTDKFVVVHEQRFGIWPHIDRYDTPVVCDHSSQYKRSQMPKVFKASDLIARLEAADDAEAAQWVRANHTTTLVWSELRSYGNKSDTVRRVAAMLVEMES